MQELRRLDDWRARLAAEMDRQRRDPFAWGKHDCAIGFAAGIVEALTGVDMARGYRGKYASPRGALKLLKDDGADTLGDFAAKFLPEGEPVFAQLGDIGIVASDGPVGEAFCMVDVSRLVVMTDNGHGSHPRYEYVDGHLKDNLLRAFQVGQRDRE